MNKLLTLGLTLAVTATSSAQLVRLEVDYIDNMGKVPGDTYRVYAVMENEGDILDAVYGEASAPMKITSTKPFYQHPKGGALSADVQRSVDVPARNFHHQFVALIGPDEVSDSTASKFTSFGGMSGRAPLLDDLTL